MGVLDIFYVIDETVVIYARRGDDPIIERFHLAHPRKARISREFKRYQCVMSVTQAVN
jgi:hypothetical protein